MKFSGLGLLVIAKAVSPLKTGDLLRSIEDLINNVEGQLSDVENFEQGDISPVHSVVRGGHDHCINDVCKSETGFALSDDTYPVRCCSDVELEGWVKNYGCNVWAQSQLEALDDAPSNGCYSSETYESAEAICEANGGRLCTEDELLGRCADYTGCMFSHVKVWSSTAAEEYFEQTENCSDEETLTYEECTEFAEAIGRTMLVCNTCDGSGDPSTRPKGCWSYTGNPDGLYYNPQPEAEDYDSGLNITSIPYQGWEVFPVLCKTVT